MYYSIKEISQSLNVSNQNINHVVFINQLIPSFGTGFNNERHFSIYQLEVIKTYLENKANALQIILDFNNEEVFTIYESKLNYLEL